MATPKKILHEITSLAQSDCFNIVFNDNKKAFNLPIHYHKEFELNFIQNGKGARRVVGDHVEEITDLELVLIGPDLQHGWLNHKCENTDITEVTIQFHNNLFEENFLRRNQLTSIRNLFEKAQRGILFSYETTKLLSYRIMRLHRKDGFESVIELMSILHELSISRHTRLLANATFNNTEPLSYNSRRIEKVMEYMNEHFHRPVPLSEVATLTNMAESAFSRFFKARTGMTFVESMTEIRLGHASRMLIDTTQSVAEIAYACGFNNISNFNHTFKKKKGYTPKQFKESYSSETSVFF